MPSPLLEKSKFFALAIIKVCNIIKRTKKESVLTNQLIRSGTSIGANIREAFYAHSKADFIAKLQIALKECSESEYWLELLIESGYYDDTATLEQCIEVKKCWSPPSTPQKTTQNDRRLRRRSIPVRVTKKSASFVRRLPIFTIQLSRSMPPSLSRLDDRELHRRCLF